MRKKFFLASSGLFFLGLLSCGMSPLPGGVTPLLPELPRDWEFLGEPEWRLEWIGPGGRKNTADFSGSPPAIEVNGEWTTAILAWPYWPARGVKPETARPGGALFPLDYDGSGRVALSWQGGVDAFFYRRLAEEAEKREGNPASRFPWYFDWARFRAGFWDADLAAISALDGDPWLADWEASAGRILDLGYYRKSFIIPSGSAALRIDGMPGRWISRSPFGKALELEEEVREAPVPDRLETWFSPEGVLKTSGRGWVYSAYKD